MELSSNAISGSMYRCDGTGIIYYGKENINCLNIGV